MRNILESNVPGHSVFVQLKGWEIAVDLWCTAEKKRTAENLSLGKTFAFPQEKFLIEFMGEGRKRLLEMYCRVSKKKTLCTVWETC